MINALAIKIFVAAIKAIIAANKDITIAMLKKKVAPEKVKQLAEGTHHLQKYPRKKAKKSEAIEVMSAYDKVDIAPLPRSYPTVEEIERFKKPIGHADGFSPQINDKPPYPEIGGDIPDGDQ